MLHGSSAETFGELTDLAACQKHTRQFLKYTLQMIRRQSEKYIYGTDLRRSEGDRGLRNTLTPSPGAHERLAVCAARK